jgi:hypothetical protein
MGRATLEAGLDSAVILVTERPDSRLQARAYGPYARLEYPPAREPRMLARPSRMPAREPRMPARLIALRRIHSGGSTTDGYTRTKRARGSGRGTGLFSK